MQIQTEAREKHSIESYSSNSIMIAGTNYTTTILVSAQNLNSDLSLNNINALGMDELNLLSQDSPELIIIGHRTPGLFPDMQLIEALSKLRIGVECMEFGAACRTFNILLSESRKVLGLFIP